jgi:dUTP pyrophosphatase
MMVVEIARLHPDARLPEYKTPGAACFDLETIEEVTLPPGEVTDVRTGLVFRIPAGHVLIVQPRSSSPRLGYIMPHSVGIIDSDYCGPEDELFLRLKNVTDRPIVFEKHQRVVQAYVAPIPSIKFKEITKSELGKKSRGGFGSTGHK